MLPSEVGYPVRDHALHTDLFGRLRVGTPFTMFDSKLLFDAQTAHWDDQQVSGSSTGSTYNTNRSSVTISVNGAVAGKRVRQSKFRPYYQPGKSQMIMVTAVVGNSDNGVTKRWGYFDGKNGLYFEYVNGVMYVCKRTYTSGVATDVRVPQSQWNREKLNSSSSLGITLDPSKGNIYFIVFEWLGLGDVQFGVVIDTEHIILHQMKHSNLENKVYMSNPNLPIRYEIESDGTGSGAVTSTMEIVCATCISDGGINPTGTIRTIDRGLSDFSTTATTTQFPILAVRLKPGCEGSIILPITCNLLCTTNGPFRWSLQLNPVLSGTALTYVDHPSANFQYCNTITNGTTVSTEGTVIMSGYGIDKGEAIQINDMPISNVIGTDIQGVSDVYALVVNSTGNKVNTFLASMTLRDIQ